MRVRAEKKSLTELFTFMRVIILSWPTKKITVHHADYPTKRERNIYSVIPQYFFLLLPLLNSEISQIVIISMIR